jgi:hypothetical protein
MCKILHVQAVEAPIEVGRLGSLADICDYYESQRALLYHAAVWIFKWNFSRIAVHHLRRLIWVAYVFDLCNAFEKVCGGLAAALTADEVESLDMYLMPDELKGWPVVIAEISPFTYNGVSR